MAISFEQAQLATAPGGPLEGLPWNHPKMIAWYAQGFKGDMRTAMTASKAMSVLAAQGRFAPGGDSVTQKSTWDSVISNLGGSPGFFANAPNQPIQGSQYGRGAGFNEAANRFNVGDETARQTRESSLSGLKGDWGNTIRRDFAKPMVSAYGLKDGGSSYSEMFKNFLQDEAADSSWNASVGDFLGTSSGPGGDGSAPLNIGDYLAGDFSDAASGAGLNRGMNYKLTMDQLFNRLKDFETTGDYGSGIETRLASLKTDDERQNAIAKSMLGQMAGAAYRRGSDESVDNYFADYKTQKEKPAGGFFSYLRDRGRF